MTDVHQEPVVSYAYQQTSVKVNFTKQDVELLLIMVHESVCLPSIHLRLLVQNVGIIITIIVTVTH